MDTSWIICLDKDSGIRGPPLQGSTVSSEYLKFLNVLK